MWWAEYSPDDRWIVSGGGDRTVRIWDGESGRLQQTLRGHRDWVRGVAFTPDGEHPITPSGTDLTLWDLRQGVERQCRRKREDLGAAQW